jgi:hypothetical protein
MDSLPFVVDREQFTPFFLDDECSALQLIYLARTAQLARSQNRPSRDFELSIAIF